MLCTVRTWLGLYSGTAVRVGTHSLVSLAVWVSAISVPLGGAVVDRWRRQDHAIVAGCLLTALAIAATPLVPAPLVWLLVAGVVVGLPPGAIVALVPSSVRPEQFAAAFGVFYATYYLGMAALQPVAGLLRDFTGSAAAPLFFAAGAMALTAVTPSVFSWVARRAPGGQGKKTR